MVPDSESKKTYIRPSERRSPTHREREGEKVGKKVKEVL